MSRVSQLLAGALGREESAKFQAWGPWSRLPRAMESSGFRVSKA